MGVIYKNGVTYGGSSAADKNVERFDTDNCIEIPANADLEASTYMEIGEYYVSSCEVAHTINHSPISNSAFRMRVYKIDEIFEEDDFITPVRMRIIILPNGDIYKQSCMFDEGMDEWLTNPWDRLATKGDIDRIPNVSKLSRGFMTIDDKNTLDDLKTRVTSLSSLKQDKLSTGTGIQIVDGAFHTISVTSDISGMKATKADKTEVALKADKTELETKADKSELAADKSQLESAIAVERARIDSFTKLAEGSTTGDAELIDARVGADGKTYTNVGGAIREQVSSLSESITEIEDDIGFNENIISYTNVINNGIKGEIGETITYTSTTAYRYTIVDVESSYYKVRTRISASSNYPHYIFTTDSNNKIISVYANEKPSSGYLTKEYKIHIPNNATKLFVLAAAESDESFSSTVVITKLELKKVLTEKISTDDIVDKSITFNKLDDEVTSLLYDNSVLLNFGLPLLDNARPHIFDKNKAKKYLNFSFITDAHYNGYYSNERSINNLKLFSILSKENWLDFSAFGGDIYSAYNLTKEDALKIIDEPLRLFGDVTKPLFMVKGNHDNNAKFMELADVSSLDWNNNHYFVFDLSIHGYKEVTQSTWDGVTPLHIGNNANDYEQAECLTDIEYYMLSQNRLRDYAVFDTDNPYGGYFYKDFNNEKVRAIVLNNYDSGILENTGAHGTQLKWLCQTALDFSDKENPSEWGVIFFIHYYVTGTTSATKMKAITDAYMNGTSVNDSFSGVSYSKDYTSQGRGTIIGMIHGDRHTDVYANNFGYPQIGVTRAFSNESEWDSEKEFAFSIFTINTDEKKIYETRIGRGSNRTFTYGDNASQLS